MLFVCVHQMAFMSTAICDIDVQGLNIQATNSKFYLWGLRKDWVMDSSMQQEKYLEAFQHT